MKVDRRLRSLSPARDQNGRPAAGRPGSHDQDLSTTLHVVNSMSGADLPHPLQEHPVTSNRYTQPTPTLPFYWSSNESARAGLQGSPRTPLAPQISTHISATHEPEAAIFELGTEPTGSVHRRPVARSITDNRRYGICVPDAAQPTYDLPQQHEMFDTSSQSSAMHAPHVHLVSSREQCTRVSCSTHRSESADSDDPPPQYAIFDTQPFFNDTISEPVTRLQQRGVVHMMNTVRKGSLKVMTGKVGRRVVKGVGDVGKLAKDMPTVLKEAQMRLNTKRAKGKLRWLEKHNYLSCQDRCLTRELRG